MAKTIYGETVKNVMKELEVQLNGENVFLHETQLMGISKGIAHELEQANLLTTEWIPIEKYIPNDHELIVLLLDDETCVLVCYLEDAGFQLNGSEEFITNAVSFYQLPD